MNGNDADVTSVVTPLIRDSLEETPWPNVAALGSLGLAETYFSLGDTKTFTDTNSVQHTVRIIHFGYGGGAILFEDFVLINVAVWNPSSNTDSDGAYNNYSESNMRTTALPAVLATYPSDLQAVINTTAYIVATNGTNNTLLTLQDKLFLGAVKEYFGIQSYSVATEAAALAQFDYYKANNTSAFRIKYDDTGKANWYWFRSCKNNSQSYAGNMDSYGNVYSYGYNSANPLRVAPLFTVGVQPN